MNLSKTLAALIAVAAASLSAQPSKAAMEALTMPAPSYSVTKDLKYPGDYGYYPLGSQRQLPHQTTDLGDPRNWYWVRYTNSGNVREVWAWASVNQSGICNHAHLSYGLWAKYEYNLGFVKLRNWVRIGMGTQSGEMINGSCKWDVENSFKRCCGEDFGHGTNYATVNIRSQPAAFKYTEFVLGALAMSHGGGTCGTFQCGHPVYMILYSLP